MRGNGRRAKGTNVIADTFDKVLDTRGLKCPVPIIKARQEINGLQPGQVLKVLSTDRGSVKDFQGWAQVSKQIALVAQNTEQMEGKEVYIHYVRRSEE